MVQNFNSSQIIAAEWDLPIKEPQSLSRKDFVAYTNGTSQASYFGGDSGLKSDFSARLIKILSGFNKEGELNDDAKSTDAVDSQLVKDNLQEFNMRGLPQSEVFTSSQLQNRLIRDLKRQTKLICKKPECSEGPVSNKIELDSYTELDEPFLGSPYITENVSQFDHFSLEETDFSSESDEDCQSDENRQTTQNEGVSSVSCSTTPFEDQKKVQPGLLSPPNNKRRGFISPRHLSRSSGSRSNPSRSSIPGLKSKYSKPDPKAKQPEKHSMPLCVLPKFEPMAEGSHKSLLHRDHLTSNGILNVCEGEETELEFDWWESDDDDDSSDGVKLFNGPEMRGPKNLPCNSDMETTLHNKSLSQNSNCSISDGFESLSKPTVKQPEKSSDFKMFDLEEKTGMRAEDIQLFEWSDSDEDSNGQNILHTKDRNGKENGVSCLDRQHSVSSQNYQQLTLPRKEHRAKSTAIRPLTWYNREESERVGSITYVDPKPLHKLPATVKFLEVPPWKTQEFSPFEIQYSYSEIPKSPVLGFRDHYSPFCPKSMGRPWTGHPLSKPRKLLGANRSSYPRVERLKLFEFSLDRDGLSSSRVKSREEVLGPPLTDNEVMHLVKSCHVEKRQVNLGRDGLTHNMLHLIHAHWKARPVCRIKCRGAPTLDMDNVCFHVEDKTGGQIIYRTGCVLYVFRGRHYSYRQRPVMPLMLYRPSSPVYPKLVPQAPAGLTVEEARQLRILGQKVKPLIKLRRNGAFPDLVRLVRDAFVVDDLVALDYDGLKAGDYRKIGAKLKELVPCVLLSFKNCRLVLWKRKSLNLSSAGTTELHVEETRLATKASAELIDAAGSFVNASKLKLVDSTEAVRGMTASFAVQSGEDTLVLSLEENTQLQPWGNDSLTQSSILEQPVQTGSEAHGAARDLVVPGDVPEASSMHGKLDDIWDMALNDGLAVELAGVDLEADLVLQAASVFSEVAPTGPEYTNQLVNKLRLQGIYENSSKEFSVRFQVKRETLSRGKRLQKQASDSHKVKRRPDEGYPLDALERILHPE
ncbi:hypothetical protein L7F22_064498 [Adiantum nelumboides]|nr:hypothetical protein [Adiantum nelumboides]